MENYEVVTLRHSIFGVLRFDILFFEFGCGYAAPGNQWFP